MKILSDLGERAAIQRIEEILTKGKHTRGIGDDCAAVDLGDQYLLVTTDMMYQKTHIPAQMTPYQIGWFLVAINLSDLAAKGGTPLGLVLSFGLPKETSELFLKELTKGANDCAVRFGTTILGGDTKETEEITLCGTAIGTVKKTEFMSRTGARPGDIVVVTGTLGKAGAGYYALKRHSTDKKMFKSLFEPLPRVKEGRLVARQHCVTSSMDLSDGLSASLYQLQECNSVGFELKKSALPLSAELFELLDKNHTINPYTIALHFGGDYELLLTMPKDCFIKAQKVVKKLGTDFTAIGRVTRKKDIVLSDGKNKRNIENKGYEHFKKHSF